MTFNQVENRTNPLPVTETPYNAVFPAKVEEEKSARTWEGIIIGIILIALLGGLSYFIRQAVSGVEEIITMVQQLG